MGQFRSFLETVDVQPTSITPDTIFNNMVKGSSHINNSFIVTKAGRLIDSEADTHIGIVFRTFPNLKGDEADEWYMDNNSNSGHISGDTAYIWGQPNPRDLDLIIGKYGVNKIRYWNKSRHWGD